MRAHSPDSAARLYAAFLGIVVPDAVSAQLSISLLLMVVLGGSGGVSGALIGAALIGFLDISGHQFENVARSRRTDVLRDRAS